jgi:hypothetical protein
MKTKGLTQNKTVHLDIESYQDERKELARNRKVKI